MRLIDADALIEILEQEEACNSVIPQRADGNRDAIMDVLLAPTIDAVPVVRCGNCYHHTFKPNTCLMFCKLHKTYVNSEDFCCHGVKDERHDKQDSSG